MVFLLITLSLLVLLLTAYLFAIRGRKGHPGLQALKGWSYAHRGLHSQGIPENSMAAFEAAKNAGYGVELDVHLLADGNLAVIHDSKLERITGKSGMIEDLTLPQLQNYHLCDTEEVIPEFSQVLNLFAGQVPLIVELKTHDNNHKQLCKTVCDLMASYPGAYCLESFDPRCILWLRKHRPLLVRGQLNEDYLAKKDSKIPWILRWLMTENLTNFITKPDFVAYRFQDRHCTLSNYFCLRRMACVTWTLTSQADYDQAKSEGWIPIFEGFRP